jgi:selenide,water dikinase
LRALADGAVHACTDVTGFGLAGHGTEMALASGVTLIIEADAIPLFRGILAMVASNRSGGLGSNHDHFSPAVRLDPAVDSALEGLLYDPQTSGGLLIAVDGAAAAHTAAALAAHGVPAHRIGTVEPAAGGVNIVVRS